VVLLSAFLLKSPEFGALSTFWGR